MNWKRIVLGTVAVLVALPVVLWAVQPWPLSLRWKDPSTTAYMEHRADQARAAGESLEIHHRWVPLDSISPHLRRAVLIAEDHRFREHRGVDWESVAEEVRYAGRIPPRPWRAGDRRALREAWAYARENADRIRGRSTITQQVARNLYLSPDRHLLRKARELLVARRLEFFLTKERILEIYLNVAEFGPGIFGVEAASHAYFGRSARELTPRQAATLAATLPHPLTSNPQRNPGRMAWRRDLILARLLGGTAPVPSPDLDSLRIAPPAPETPVLPVEFLEPLSPPPLPPPRVSPAPPDSGSGSGD
jgi:monofunctional glycosyltransferase